MLLWLICAVIAIWMALRHIPSRWDVYRPLPELIALIPLVWIPTAVILLVCVLVGAVPQGITAAALLCVQGLWHAAMLLDMPGPLLRLTGLPERRSTAEHGTHSGDALHVMTLNCRFGRADPISVIRTVRDNHIDVLALQEVTPELLQSLETAGLGTELSYAVTGASRDDDNGGSNALLLRVEANSSEESSITLPAAAIPTATLTLGETSIRFASAHPKSPGRGGRFWHQGIQSLGELGGSPSYWDSEPTSSDAWSDQQIPASAKTRRASAVETVLLGDLNSSLYHPVFRSLLRTSSFFDASYELGKGYHYTFPSSWRWIPALIEIDHVLLTPGLRPVAMKSLPIPGSDHRALVASIRVA